MLSNLLLKVLIAFKIFRMYVQQSHSILFYIRQSKKNKGGKVPVYARMTIDGLKKARAVKGVKILPGHWEPDNKLVKARRKRYKTWL